MAQKEQQRAVYRTAKGREVDMTKLISQNELTLAVGNMSVNARGDKIGPGGKIIANRDQLQSANTLVSEQINVRKPTVEELAKPKTAAEKAKAIEDMDPEGNE